MNFFCKDSAFFMWRERTRQIVIALYLHMFRFVFSFNDKFPHSFSAELFRLKHKSDKLFLIKFYFMYFRRSCSRSFGCACILIYLRQETSYSLFLLCDTCYFSGSRSQFFFSPSFLAMSTKYGYKLRRCIQYHLNEH